MPRLDPAGCGRRRHQRASERRRRGKRLSSGLLGQGHRRCRRSRTGGIGHRRRGAHPDVDAPAHGAHPANGFRRTQGTGTVFTAGGKEIPGASGSHRPGQSFGRHPAGQPPADRVRRAQSGGFFAGDPQSPGHYAGTELPGDHDPGKARTGKPAKRKSSTFSPGIPPAATMPSPWTSAQPPFTAS